MGRARVVRGQVREFWCARLGGLEHEAACVRVGVSQHTGWRWVREVGGMIPDLSEPTGRYLSRAEREEISRGLAAGQKQADIARVLGRDPGTISREIARNHTPSLRPGRHGPPRPDAGPPRPGRRVCASPREANERAYRGNQAQTKAEARARRPKPTKLASHPELVAEIQARLQVRWSPQQIAADLRAQFPDRPEMWVSHETIYQELYVQGRGSLRRELARCLRTGRALRRPRAFSQRSSRSYITPEVTISARPAEARDRAVPGHWEGDLILGAGNASAIGTLVERTTRFVLLLHLPGRHDAEAVRDAMIPTIGALPAELRRSLAWDQGSEMARHAQISIATDLPVYFCDPHSPWQRGSNENTNGLLRQYFPKGTDLSVHSAAHLAAVAAELNGRPRKTLDWRSPARALDQLLSDPLTTGVATTP